MQAPSVRVLIWPALTLSGAGCKGFKRRGATLPRLTTTAWLAMLTRALVDRRDGRNCRDVLPIQRWSGSDQSSNSLRAWCGWNGRGDSACCTASLLEDILAKSHALVVGKDCEGLFGQIAIRFDKSVLFYDTFVFFKRTFNPVHVIAISIGHGG
jgi:hypothetical protein